MLAKTLEGVPHFELFIGVPYMDKHYIEADAIDLGYCPSLGINTKLFSTTI